MNFIFQNISFLNEINVSMRYNFTIKELYNIEIGNNVCLGRECVIVCYEKYADFFTE